MEMINVMMKVLLIFKSMPKSTGNSWKNDPVKIKEINPIVKR